MKLDKYSFDLNPQEELSERIWIQIDKAYFKAMLFSSKYYTI